LDGSPGGLSRRLPQRVRHWNAADPNILRRDSNGNTGEGKTMPIFIDSCDAPVLELRKIQPMPAAAEREGFT
jgi:hypothetical protein